VDLAAMLQLARLICQHAIADVSSVEVWEAEWHGATRVAFSWWSEGVIAAQ
jgi:hypothetical protein